jgi:hypothetical protein
MTDQNSTEIMIGELERFIFCRAETKPDQDAAMDILHELEERLGLDTKALELAVDLLSNNLIGCPREALKNHTCRNLNCPSPLAQKECWLRYFRQKAGEETK